MFRCFRCVGQSTSVDMRVLNKGEGEEREKREGEEWYYDRKLGVRVIGF